MRATSAIAGSDTTIQDVVQKALNCTTTDGDTHPAPADRFRLAEKVQCKTPLPVHGTVWDLFHEREALTREMNGIIEEAGATPPAPQ